MIRGTLVLMVPTAEGLLIAADSRVTNEKNDRYCDEDFKIIELSRPDRTVATVTGFSALREPSEDQDFCRHLRESLCWLDCREMIRRCIESAGLDAEHASVAELREPFQAAFDAMPTKAKEIARSLAGGIKALIAVATYDPSRPLSVLRWGRMQLAPNLRVSFYDETVVKIGPGHERMFYRLGEQEFVERFVLMPRAPGRALLSPDTIAFFSQRRTVRDTSRTQAKRVVLNVMSAASKMVDCYGASSGIGGPTDMVFLGAEPRPRRLAWKSVRPNLTT